MIKNLNVQPQCPLEAEEELWVAVLLDAIDIYKHQRSLTAWHEAQYFLFYDTTWFPIVCAFSRLNFLAVREQLVRGANKGDLPGPCGPLPGLLNAGDSPVPPAELAGAARIFHLRRIH